MPKKIIPYKDILLYALAMALLMLILEFIKYKFLILSSNVEIYVALVALFFTVLGIWLAQKITKPKIETIVVEKEILIHNGTFVCNEIEIQNLKISKRELEVLELISKGMSNQEIASHLFVSLHTIKTHSSNLFDKLDVKRRTQAVEKAKKLQLIA